ncbi:RidA family protein [Chelatococcus sp. GCM10030263]|uniref:RidA family protein n=1 Tax=Chelatococcus sp. GCM10030263 TaxID=3273387 RepID=UPI00361A228C
MKRFIGEPLPVPLTPAVQCGSMLFLSGQVPTRPDGSIPEGIAAQTELVLQKLGALAKEAGYDYGDIVKTTVFLRDMKDFDAVNDVYRKFFPKDPPARSCVRAEVAIAADVEIEAIAMKDQ